MSAQKMTIENEREYVERLIGRIVAECPERQATSADERRAQEIMKEEFAALGTRPTEHHFLFNDNLYKNLILHFGLGTLGTAVSGIAPGLAMVMHLAAGISYHSDSTRKGYLLRRLLKFKPSKNIIVTLPAKKKLKARIVMLGHIDAAFTGFIFDPRMVKTLATSQMPESLKFLERSLEAATNSQFILAGMDLTRMVFGRLATWPLRPLEAALTIPSFLVTALNAELVLRNEIVPGANDDLSGVAALPLLLERLRDAKPDDVEFVFVSTGAEEASLGGGDALARDMEDAWEKDKTVVIALDGLTNGDLKFVSAEGEVVSRTIPGWLHELIVDTAASDPQWLKVEGVNPPVGGSDVSAFLARGYQGVCLACVDPEFGSPRHYHQPSDSPANLDIDRLLNSVDFAELLVRNIVERMTGQSMKRATEKVEKTAASPHARAKSAKKTR